VKGNHSSSIDGLHLFTLVGFAMAQPLFDLLGRTPAFFHVHRAGQQPAAFSPSASSCGGALRLEAANGLLGRRVRQCGVLVALLVAAALPILGRHLPVAGPPALGRLRPR
jgi:hypothetical protein